MDFRRVEGIFFIVFLFLNMFLFYIYQEGREPQDYISTGSISENLEERLKADHIEVPKDLSKIKREGYYLSAEEDELVADAREKLTDQSWQVNNDQLTSQIMSQSDTVIKKSKDIESINQFIRNPSNVLYGKDYVLNEEETIPLKNYIYNQTYEGIPFYDETAQLSVIVSQDKFESDQISSYKQTHISRIEPLREVQSVISERDAIISLYTNNRIQSGDTVKWIHLGYTRIFTVRGKNVYIPAWFVSVESSKNVTQTERVNAFTNAVISSSVSEVINK
ncbi:two-component system regulatory protein YycI [Vagococcus bubulae]|uniref:two-component system regulatory protein YycI n=1 Tax=Vagococcus bubulae TaxID=1977868 RepID=UPI0022E0CBFA|nr:two-component system regulatory protein YycI [Vagococcus bubulae]